VEGPSGLSFSRHSFTSPVPLAEQMRPSDLTHYFGQEHVLGQDKVLRMLLEKRDIPSMILWGPPGCGKVLTSNMKQIYYIPFKGYSMLLDEL
jgi:putative ATPase